jgi:hypothetical protein
MDTLSSFSSCELLEDFITNTRESYTYNENQYLQLKKDLNTSINLIFVNIGAFLIIVVAYLLTVVLFP